jgi:methenyltetrahydromethanopterin cyclohydrolase
MVNLNRQALEVCRHLTEAADRLRVATVKVGDGAQVIDCGIHVAGGLEAGRLLAECCLAGLGTVEIVPGDKSVWNGPFVQVRTDQPVAACMASQYAGWEIKAGDFFAMGSGPMRAAANREELFETIGYAEKPDVAVGVLETAVLPTPAVVQLLAKACNVRPRDLVLLVARTASQAGTVQVVARSVETTLHKLHELEFDLDRVESAWGVAPLPPVAANDLAGIGRTNDAILYGGSVTLWVRGDDDSLQAVGPNIPSCSSSDHGAPFAEIFARYDNDFYKIDRHLFSPAEVMLANLDTGHSFRFGKTMPEVIRKSFSD